MGTPLTFEVDVVAGKTYEVMILTGRHGWNHDKQQFTVDGVRTAPTVLARRCDTWGAGRRTAAA